MPGRIATDQTCHGLGQLVLVFHQVMPVEKTLLQQVLGRGAQMGRHATQPVLTIHDERRLLRQRAGKLLGDFLVGQRSFDIWHGHYG